MFEYTHEVRGFDKASKKDDESSWGIFPNEGIAKIMLAELSRKFTNTKYGFYIKEIR